eukprot:scaffold130613_cov36-Phaeocystis_antarctica.AAC.3
MKAEVAEPIHTLGGLSTTGLFFSSGGGKGANQATSVARLGVPTSLVGRIGNDAISQASRHAHDAPRACPHACPRAYLTSPRPRRDLAGSARDDPQHATARPERPGAR